ncbi:MAG: hypothetical protein GJT30_02140 [Geobacter sp.]|nr:hypothetical protein [Geobacter sp.]
MNWFSPVNRTSAQRERFASPMAVAGMFLSFVLLLVVLYPEREILALLRTGELGSPVAMHYLRALAGIRPNDGALQLSYAEALVAAKRFSSALPVLDLAAAHLPPSQQRHCLELRLVILQGLLRETPANAPNRQVLEAYFSVTARQLAGSGSSLEDLRRYLGQARFAGAAEALSYLEGKVTPHGTANSRLDIPNLPSEETPESALAAGDYRKSAQLYFDAMASEPDQLQRRRLYLKGVRTLQAGNLVEEALAAADQYMGAIQVDRDTLIYLTRLALAANRPAKAQEYVKRALGEKTRAEGGNG